MKAKTTIKMNQPKELLAKGHTTFQLKPRKNHVINFPMPDLDNSKFLLGRT